MHSEGSETPPAQQAMVRMDGLWGGYGPVVLTPRQRALSGSRARDSGAGYGSESPSRYGPAGGPGWDRRRDGRRHFRPPAGRVPVRHQQWRQAQALRFPVLQVGLVAPGPWGRGLPLRSRWAGHWR